MVPGIDMALHDAYAADYDEQMQVYNCHLPDVLFGLCYEFIQPSQVILAAGIGAGGVCGGSKAHDLVQVPWRT